MRATIAGIGCVSALGRGAAAQWRALAAGESGIRPIARFDVAGYDARLGGMVADRNGPGDAGELCIEFGIAAAREAWDEAQTAAQLAGLAADRVALVVGSSLGDEHVPLHLLVQAIGDALGVGGPRLVVSTACTSSTNAIGLGLDLLEAGAADCVLAGGADVLTPLVHAGFSALGVLAAGPCAPFSSPPGTTLGEGAAFLALVRDPAAGRFAVHGYGLSADAYHETGPDPSGAGVARAVRGALAHAGVEAAAIGYVNAHGTGTAAGDPAEWRALRHVLGAHAERIPISASKSFLGHAQGAAGAVEVVATLAALAHGAVPPTRNGTGARPNSPPDLVAQELPRPHAYDLALCNNSGFGGANCAVVVGAAGPSVAAAPRPTFVAGLGTADATPELRAFGVDARGFDPATRMLVGAAAVALADADPKFVRQRSDRAGLVVGMDRVSDAAYEALRETIDARGLKLLSATMFARMVLNATTGSCAIAMGLRGPCSTLSTGGASGLAAIAYAAHLLAYRTDADRIVAGGVEERSPLWLSEHAPAPGARWADGAACAVLTAAPSRVRLAGWAFGGPDTGAGTAAATARTIRAALALAGAAPSSLDLVIGPPLPGLEVPHVDARARFGDAGAALSALAFTHAAAEIRAGRARRVLVVGEPGTCASVAAVLEEHHV